MPPARTADRVDGTGDASRPEGARRDKRRRGLGRFVPTPLLRLGRLLIVALVVDILVVPQLAGTRKAFNTLTKVNPLLLLLGLGLEAAALLAYALLSRAVIPAESDPGLSKLLRIQLTTKSVSHCVPGGTAAGSSLGYRLLTSAGVRGTDVGFALAAQGLGSAVVLNVIFWLALIVSIPVWGFNPLYATAAAVGAVLAGCFVALVFFFSREKVADSVLTRVISRLPMVDHEAVRDLFVRLSERIRDLARQPKVLARAVAWAAANWLLDAASLYVFVGAFGHWVNPDGLLVSYGLANILAAIPLTPGGLGVVEATLTSTLVGFNTTRAVALLGVVAYRLVSFWLPIPVGGFAYLTLQVDEAQTVSRRERLARIAEYVWGDASPARRALARRAADRHGDPSGRRAAREATHVP